MKKDIIPNDYVINKDLVKKVLHEQFSLKVSEIVLLGEGWDNRAYLINDHFVFRFPRRQETIEGLKREMRVLPKISKLLPFTIPTPQFFGVPGPDFPEVFYGYSMIKANSGCALQLSSSEYIEAAHSLGHFLKSLHSISIANLHLEEIDRIPTFNRLEMDNLLLNMEKRIKEIKDAYDMRIYEDKIKNICSLARSYQYNKENVCFVHNDLYHRHLLFNELNQLIGLIDWGDCGLGNFVVDLGVLYQFFPSYAHSSFIQSYGKVSDEALAYARFLGLYYAIALLWFGHARKDKDLIKSSLWTLAEI